jgi:hypothetical protein
MLEDVFLWKFMQSSFPGCLANQLVLQFQANKVDICAVVLCHQPTHKFHFLTGCGETLLSHFYKCPVWNHLQTVPIKVVISTSRRRLSSHEQSLHRTLSVTEEWGDTEPGSMSCLRKEPSVLSCC